MGDPGAQFQMIGLLGCFLSHTLSHFLLACFFFSYLPPPWWILDYGLFSFSYFISHGGSTISMLVFAEKSVDTMIKTI